MKVAYSRRWAIAKGLPLASSATPSQVDSGRGAEHQGAQAVAAPR